MSPANVNNISIRSLNSSDVPRVRELHFKLLPVSYPYSFFVQLLVLPNRSCFVAYAEGHPKVPIGFISAAIQPSSASVVPRISHSSPDFSPSNSVDLTKPRLEILTLGVLPACQHCGLAKLLMKRTIESFHQSCAIIPNTESIGGTLVHANVATSNLEAIRFYERMGMIIASPVIRNLYRTPSSGSKDAYLVAGVV
ncbi:acyl-CoA N-acyltransferase [Crepidotus variabilis]|uniref:N-alpha-acetyltransferase 60 n=1 Tax=Crepidotus variabilis TaxID=179855 RepID=A0A9P6JPR9_9AGAR|nr:acyl-CoA N-acyltransferase [Crepidotus variabilis]